MASNHDILCGTCKTPVEGPEEPSDDDVIECNGCGQSDRYADVLEAVKEYATDSLGRNFQDTMKDAVRGSKFMTFKTDPIPNRSYRWIVADLKF